MARPRKIDTHLPAGVYLRHGAYYRVVSKGRRPLAPSIDRIDSSLGYTRQNCRIVCAAVNYAMNVWGEDVLWRLFKRRPLLDVSNTAIGHTDSSR